MINKILLGSVSGAALIAMGFLSWQGWQLDQTRKAVARSEAAKARLAGELVAAQKAVKVEIVTKNVYIQAERAKNEINATDCNSVVPVWRDGIERVRAQADAANDDPFTPKP
jgi:uncharacterized iron-regulated membrane protein